MIRKFGFLLSAPLLLSACFFQPGKKNLYEQVVKIGPSDSLAVVPQQVKNQLYRLLSRQQPGNGLAAAHLLLTGANRPVANNTIHWLAAKTQLDVYRVDLSLLAGNYIGETEKNLDQVFSKAENQHSVLFFDEADALFGKRTNVQDAHDKYANAEIAYLLQHIETFKGMVVLPCNLNNCLTGEEQKKFTPIFAGENVAATK